MYGNWFKDKSIIEQELVILRDKEGDKDAVSILVDSMEQGTEIILTRDELLKCLLAMEN
jgi:hypothetical protein